MHSLFTQYNLTTWWTVVGQWYLACFHRCFRHRSRWGRSSLHQYKVQCWVPLWKGTYYDLLLAVMFWYCPWWEIEYICVLLSLPINDKWNCLILEFFHLHSNCSSLTKIHVKTDSQTHSCHTSYTNTHIVTCGRCQTFIKWNNGNRKGILGWAHWDTFINVL